MESQIDREKTEVCSQCGPKGHRCLICPNNPKTEGNLKMWPSTPEQESHRQTLEMQQLRKEFDERGQKLEELKNILKFTLTNVLDLSNKVEKLLQDRS